MVTHLRARSLALTDVICIRLILKHIFSNLLYIVHTW